MYLLRLALASLNNRRFTALLTVFAIALSVCLLLGAIAVPGLRALPRLGHTSRSVKRTILFTPRSTSPPRREPQRSHRAPTASSQSCRTKNFTILMKLRSSVCVSKLRCRAAA